MVSIHIIRRSVPNANFACHTDAWNTRGIYFWSLWGTDNPWNTDYRQRADPEEKIQSCVGWKLAGAVMRLRVCNLNFGACQDYRHPYPVNKAIQRPNTYSSLSCSLSWVYNKRVRASGCLFMLFMCISCQYTIWYWMPCFDCHVWSGNIDILVIGIWFRSSSIQSVRCSTRSLGYTGSHARGVNQY